MEVVSMPRLGVTMTSGTVVGWKKNIGDRIEVGEPLFEMETDKSTLEIEAAYAGVLKAIIVELGVVVPCGTPIAVIGAAEEEINLAQFNISEQKMDSAIDEIAVKTEKVVAKESGSGITVTPRVRRLAAELGINLENIKGTGPGGVIREEDVRNATNDSIKVKEKIKLNSVRKSMAKKMLDSWNKVPHFVQMVTVNAENIKKVKSEIGQVSINDIMIKAIANAVKDQPLVNSTLLDDEIVVYDEVNISVAMVTKDGLIVPVVKSADKKSVNSISAEIRAYSEKAASGQLTIKDMSNGTITISNLGAFGIETGTPIINHPQGTIVFIGSIRKVPVVNDKDEIVVGNIMEIAIGYDHRFIDGATASQFTTGVKKEIETITKEKLI